MSSVRGEMMRKVAWRDSALSVALAFILMGALLYFFVPALRIMVLFLLFLPVVAGAARLGARTGLALGAVEVTLVLIPIAFAGPEYVSADTESLPGGGWTLTFWAALLLLSAQITGWVAEDAVAEHTAPEDWEDPTKVLERERKRLALDLHDGIAQTVSATLMQVELLDALTAESPGEVREEVARLKQMCSGSLREIRTMVGTLKPPALSAPRFKETLEDLTTRFRAKTGIPVDLQVSGELQNYSDSMRICTYRVIQEALSNTEHHAGASRVHIALDTSSDLVSLQVGDDGAGFDTTEVNLFESNGHMGLMGMKERVELLEGTLDIQSSPGKGTLIRAEIPSRNPAGKR